MGQHKWSINIKLDFYSNWIGSKFLKILPMSWFSILTLWLGWWCQKICTALRLPLLSHLNFDFTNHDLSIVKRGLDSNLKSDFSNHDLSIVKGGLNQHSNFYSSNHDSCTVKGALILNLSFDSSNRDFCIVLRG